MADFRIGNIIGKGAFGSVHKAILTDNNKLYAVKRIAIKNSSRYDIINTVNELRILSSHKCPFIMPFKSAYIDANNILCIVMEYAANGDLAGVMQKKREANRDMLDWDVWHYTLQLILAIGYLHKFKIIHRDIKPANIMIDDANNIKLGDFGVTKLMKAYMMYGQTQVGTPYYMGPELLRCERYDEKVDIWSLGCVLYELMYLKHPFVGAKNFVDLRNCVLKTVIQPLAQPPRSSELKTLVQSLLRPHPRQRPHITSIINNKHVSTQIRARRLEFALQYSIKSTFYTNTPVPRTRQDWEAILRLHVDASATVTPQHKHRLDMCNIAKRDVPSEFTVAQLQSWIADAKRFIERCQAHIHHHERRLK